MSEWFHNQNKPTSDFRELLQERIEKTNPRRTLTVEETTRLNKFEEIGDTLKRGENVLSESQKNQYNFYIEKIDAICM